MVDREKIIIMTKLAIYDKNNGPQDRKINEYFRSDYIYRSNMWTRLCAAIGCFIVILFYWLHKVFIDGVDIFTLDFQKTGTDIAFIVAAVLLFYTLIGTVKVTVEYAASQRRLKKYNKLLNQLEQIDKNASQDTEEASDLYYGADSTFKRDNY